MTGVHTSSRSTGEEVFRSLWRTTHAIFGLFGDFEDPAELTGLLQMAPTWCFGKNEQYVGHIDRETLGVRRRHTGNWSLYSTAFVTSDDPREHVEALVRLLEPRADIIAKLRSDRRLKAMFWIGYAAPFVSDPGYSLPADLLNRLSKVCDEVCFTHYCLDAHAAEKDETPSEQPKDPAG